MGRSAIDAGRHHRLHPLRYQRLEPLATIVLAAGLTLAIATDGVLPDVWTRALLVLALPFNVVTAARLTRPRA